MVRHPLQDYSLSAALQSFGTAAWTMRPWHTRQVGHDPLMVSLANRLQLIQTLRLHGGGALLHSYKDDTLQLKGITHIISTTFDFPEYDAACDALIPVVKPTWVDASLMRDKLANPRQYNPDPRLFLSDVVVCCADLPEGDADAIAGGVLAMGGLYTTKVTGQVTHIVALTMESDKCAIVVSKKLSIKIVLPHW